MQAKAAVSGWRPRQSGASAAHCDASSHNVYNNFLEILAIRKMLLAIVGLSAMLAGPLAAAAAAVTGCVTDPRELL